MSTVNTRAQRRGKDHERAIAKRLNGQRNGATGLATSDVDAGPWSIECKAWKRLPVSITEAMAQSVRNAPTGKTPILIIHKAGQRHDSDLVIMRLRDWQEWHGERPKENEEEVCPA